MGSSGEQPPKQQTLPQPAEDPVRLEAHAFGEARIHQAGRDQHLYYGDGVRRVRRVKPGTQAQECPYPGLASFSREQAQWFFGRDQLTAKLIAHLDDRLRTGGVQVVVATSGAGKSSLLHAGLLSQLGNGALPGSSRWPTIVLTPTADPLAALASQIASFASVDPTTLARELAADSQRCMEVLRGHIGNQDSGTRVVVVVDQFEELFTLCTDDQQRRTFIELLSQLASRRSDNPADAQPVGLITVGVRADFYTACANYRHLRAALEDNQLVVGPMSDTELREAILYPAQAVGLDVEPGLVELLLRDLGDIATTMSEISTTSYEAGRLPLLAHALRATWQQRHGHTLTVDGYRATGGIHRAVATTAEGVFAGLDPAGQHAARTLFLRLIKIGEGAEDTRRRVARAGLLRGLNPGIALPVVDAFTQGRLLTQEQDTVEITHEALLRAWPRLRQWIDIDRGGNLIRQELEDAAAVWDRNRSDTAVLYRGSRLEAARTWAAFRSIEGDLSPAASAFLVASTQQKRRAARLRRALLIVLSVFALIASGAAAVAIQQSAAARRERDNAIFNQVTAQADRLRSTDVSLAAQLYLTAYRMRSTPDLYTALVTMGNAALSTPLSGHTDKVHMGVFSPDGRTLASSSADKTVRLWNVTDLAHPTPLGPPLTGHTSDVNGVAFNPDGRTLASSSNDKTVRLWDVTDPARPVPLGQPLTGHTDLVTGVMFSPDGRTLASSSNDKTVRLWNVTDPNHTTPLDQPLTGHTSSIYAVAFSPNGRTLASSSADHTVRLWNIPSALMAGHTSAVYSVVFSRDGRTLASSSGDRTVRLWDVTDPARPVPLGQPLTGHTGAVISLVFSPDGRTLASGSADKTVRLWNVSDPAHPTPLGPPVTGHTNSINAVVFSPDGRTLASSSGDQTVRLWNVSDPAHPTPLSQPLTDHTDRVNGVMFSPDGRILASSSNDRTVRLWNVADVTHPRALSTLTGHKDRVFYVMFSPDGRTLASSSADQTLRWWNVTDPTYPTTLGQPLTGHPDSVFSMTFSPDWSNLATGSNEGTIRMWRINLEQAVQRICATTANTLTPEKWEQYVSPDLAYRPPCP
jgi:WD40 repeat protein